LTSITLEMSTNQVGTNEFNAGGVHSMLDSGAYVRTRRTD
jgi:hypothetical protein